MSVESTAPSLPDGAPPKRAVVFIDGQNLFHAVKKVFGARYPNYHVNRLAESVCNRYGWRLDQIRFYTGVHRPDKNPYWHGFWERKLLSMSRAGVNVFKRHLLYQTEERILSDGTRYQFEYSKEKGVDVRIALDLIRLCYDAAFDVALIFSQDQDLSEAVEDVISLGRQQSRTVTVASAFPWDERFADRHGIRKTTNIRIRRDEYQGCIDQHDYRPSA